MSPTKPISDLTDKDKLYLLRKLFKNVTEFINECIPNTIVSSKQTESFSLEKINIKAELHDIHVKLSNLLVGKWEKEPELIEYKSKK